MATESEVSCDRRRRRGQRKGRRSTPVSTDPAARAHHRPRVRDPVPRPGRRGVRFHVRLMHERRKAMKHTWTRVALLIGGIVVTQTSLVATSETAIGGAPAAQARADGGADA